MPLDENGFNSVSREIISATQKAFRTCKTPELFHVPLEGLEQFVSDAVNAFNTRKADCHEELVAADEIIETAAKALYAQESARANYTSEILSLGAGKPIKDEMEPWEECRDIYIGDAKAVIVAIPEFNKAIALLKRIEPHIDAIVCYASTMDEHAPNRLAVDLRNFLDSRAEDEVEHFESCECCGDFSRIEAKHDELKKLVVNFLQADGDSEEAHAIIELQAFVMPLARDEGGM